MWRHPRRQSLAVLAITDAQVVSDRPVETVGWVKMCRLPRRQSLAVLAIIDAQVVGDRPVETLVSFKMATPTSSVASCASDHRRTSRQRQISRNCRLG